MNLGMGERGYNPIHNGCVEFALMKASSKVCPKRKSFLSDFGKFYPKSNESIQPKER